MRKIFLITLLSILIIAGCSNEPKMTAQEYQNSASALFDVGNYEGAIKQYENLMKYYPENTMALRAQFSIAEIYKNNLNEYDKAIGVYNKICKDFPESEKAPNAKFMIAYLYANDMQDLDQAKISYQEFINEYPDHMLVPSAEWEIKNLGKSLDEIEQLNVISK